ncbi:MAG TPA: OB-fold domain-containing protein [Acidimicrobiia bacterium]
MTAFPHPALTGDAAPFWLAASEGRLAIQACGECGTLRHPPRPVCAHCGATAVEWRTVSGRGELWSFTVVHRPTLPAFDERVPYVAIVVRLEEGPFLVSTLVGFDGDAAAAAREDLAAGAPVEVVFERIADELTLPLFRLVAPPSR